MLVSDIPSILQFDLGERLAHCAEAWAVIGASTWVKKVISQGYRIPFKRSDPVQTRVPSNPTVDKLSTAWTVLKDEAIDLLKKAAVTVVGFVSGQYILSYFAVPKARSPGKFRPILNLKKFNKNVKKYHFRMETLAMVRDWVQPGAFFCRVDLKDAFPHIPIHPTFRKCLRFVWLGKLLEWKVLPFGLRCSPRVLTKVVKPVVAFIWATWGILLSVYMDDMLLQASTADLAYLQIQIVVLVFMCLGWSINWEKSNFIPSQTIIHLVSSWTV